MIMMRVSQCFLQHCDRSWQHCRILQHILFIRLDLSNSLHPHNEIYLWLNLVENISPQVIYHTMPLPLESVLSLFVFDDILNKFFFCAWALYNHTTQACVTDNKQRQVLRFERWPDLWWKNPLKRSDLMRSDGNFSTEMTRPAPAKRRYHHAVFSHRRDYSSLSALAPFPEDRDFLNRR